MTVSDITKLFNSQKSKLKLDFDITVKVLKKDESDDYDATIFLVGRSERDTHDKNTFIVLYNKDLVTTLTPIELKKAVFHEILHMLTWPLIDEHQEVLKHIKNKQLATEMVLRARTTWENVVYTLEKKLFNKLV